MEILKNQNAEIFNDFIKIFYKLLSCMYYNGIDLFTSKDYHSQTGPFVQSRLVDYVCNIKEYFKDVNGEWMNNLKESYNETTQKFRSYNKNTNTGNFGESSSKLNKRNLKSVIDDICVEL